jgi:hypothetical protein
VSQLEIAKKTFESAGGSLAFFCFAKNDAFIRVFLRQPQLQLDLYREPAMRETEKIAIGTIPLFPQVS